MRLDLAFFQRDVLEVAPDLLSKVLVRQYADGKQERFVISEVEAYRGEEDKACHANKGRTARTEVMYHAGGAVYVYLIYGMYWLLNVVTGSEGNPQAVLIRGAREVSGPGRLGKAMQLDKSFYGESLIDSPRLWIEDELSSALAPDCECHPRIGIDYAGALWRDKKWRFLLP